MTTKNISSASAILIALSLPLAQAAILPGAISVEDLREETSARKALKQVEVSAAEVMDEASHLNAIANPELSPESNADALAALKEKVNRMGLEIHSLEAQHESLPPWERQAVNTVLPLLHDAVANTDNAIEYFKANRDHSWTKAYHGYVGHVAQDSEQIAKTVKDYLKYDQLREREMQIEKRIWEESGE